MATNLVICKICKEKIDRDLAFKVGTRSYYCNKSEYLSYLNNKKSKNKSKKKTKQETMELIFEVFEYEVTNTLLSNELRELAKLYTYDNIYSYIQENFEHLNKSLHPTTFEFNGERGKIKYFLAIIKNHIVDYLNNKKIEKENTEYLNEEINYDGIFENVKYKEKNKRRALYEIEMEVIAEDG